MIEIDLDFIFFSVGIFFSLPIFWLLLAQKRQEPDGSEVVQVPTMIVLGSGGHTTEILRLSCSLREAVYRPRCYVIADSDVTSEGRLRMASIGKNMLTYATFLEVPSQNCKMRILSPLQAK